ncbi:hypothetical protein LCGC14_0591140 [marine sediment metagenome]|uniref:Uncharacterized protein n=1 Tax=marine sediment metagenome TaxID=412755 RepID=A0A0F9RDG9_9ZZZZ|nr:hypothetical protein [archaeon]HEC38320.1 hypothetical protein [bacterium]
MTESQEIINVVPQYIPLDEIEDIFKEKITIFYKNSGPTKQWKESMGNYLLNPSKFHFGLKDL